MFTQIGEALLEQYGNLIDASTCREALAAGHLLWVSKDYPEACRRYKTPVFFTRAVWDLVAAASPHYSSENPVALIVSDIINMSVSYLSQNDRCVFSVSIQSVPPMLGFDEDEDEKAMMPRYQLVAQSGPMDIDDPTPVVTIMFPHEL